MQKLRHAVALGLVLATPHLSFAAPYGQHEIIYTNSKSEALAACNQYAANTPIPPECPVYPAVQTSYACSQADTNFATGLRQHAVVLQDWAKNSETTICGYRGTNNVHFVYPTTACPAGTTFTGPSPGDCFSPDFVALVNEHAKQGSENATCTVGNPCDVSSGNKYQAELDFTGGTGVPSVSRQYRSLSLKSAGAGVGWLFSFQKSVDITQPGSAISLIRADGHTEKFTYNNGQWSGDTDSRLRVSGGISTPFTVTLPDGSVESYDTASGVLLSEANTLGQTTTYTWSSGNLTQITGPFGHTLTLTWSGTPARITKITLPDSRQITYTYSTNLNLTQVGYPNGKSRTYHYENTTFPHALTGITDESGTRFATYTYASSGLVATSEHAGGTGKFSLSYSGGNSSIQLDNAPYFSATFDRIQNLNRLTRQTWTDGSYTQLAWDTQGRLTNRTDELGRATSYTWDSQNRLSTTTDPLNRTTQFTWLGALSLPQSISMPSVAPGQSKTITFQYDAQNRPLQVSESGFTPSGTVVSRTRSMTWTSLGQIASVTDARSYTTSFDYWPTTTGGQRGQLWKITNPLNQITTFDSYDGAGRLTQETSPAGIVTKYVYDAVGRLVQREQSNASGSTFRRTNYQYNSAGLLSSVQQVLVKGSSSDTGYTHTYAYDAAQRLASITDATGNKVVYGYDAKNNQVSFEIRDGSNVLVQQIQQTYDARNRLTSINAGGSITQLGYDVASQNTSLIDPKNQNTTFLYDLAGRRTQQTDPLNGITQITYNPADWVSSVTSPNNANTGYVVDDLGNHLSESSPDRGGLSFTHDPNGNPLTRTDARGVQTSFTYDPLNRLTSQSFPQTGEDVAYTYDTCQIGKLCAVVDASGSWAFTYDGIGRPVGSAWTSQGHTYSTSYQWNAADQLTGITYPSGRSVNYARNTLGQISGITFNGSNIVSARAYRADGQLTGQTYGNGLVDTRAYDLQGRLTNWSTGSLDTRSYTYDPNGNITAINTKGFTYDPLDRLTSEPNQSFALDANSNRLSDAAGSYTYTPNSNRMTSSPAGTVALDPAGNTTTIGNKAFAYNQTGKLISASLNGTPVGQYQYAFDGRRTAKTTGGITTLFHYDLAGKLIAETDTSGNTLKEYIWDENARPLAQIEANGITYLHPDHLSTPRLGTNNAGSLVWQWDGQAFGSSAPVIQTTTVNLRFPGQYFDVESGLHQNWHRTYDPSSGRYLESDPIGLSGGGNTFAYVEGDPIRYTDPLGLDRHIIFTTEGHPENGPDPWQKAAGAAKRDVLKQCGCSESDVVRYDVKTVSQVNNILSSTKDIGSVYFIGHSGLGGIYIGAKSAPDTNISSNPGQNNIHPKSINWSNLNSRAKIYVWGCNSTRIAQELAEASGRVAGGFSNFVNFDRSGQPFVRWIRPGGYEEYLPKGKR